MSLGSILIATLLSWGAAFAPDGQRLYALHLPPDGSLDKVAAEAVGAWEHALGPGQLSIMLTHDECPDRGLHQMKETGALVRSICLEGVDSATIEKIDNNPQQVGVTWRRDGVEQIRIDVEYLEGVGEVEVLAHELGHAMGLNHLKWRGALMYPSMRDEADPTPWRVDLQAWHRVRR